MSQRSDVPNQEPEQWNDACEIHLIRNDDGQVTGVEVDCVVEDPLEVSGVRAEMAAAINNHELVVKARAREQVQQPSTSNK